MADTPGPGGIPSTPTPGGATSMLAPGTPGAPPVAPPVTPPVTPPPVVPPVTPPAEGTTPWKEGEVWKIDGKDWWEYIPEEAVRETVKAKQYANPAVQAVAYSNLLKLQNGNDNVLVLPAQDATPEQRAEFDKRIRALNGVPETADKYELNAGDKADPKFVEFGRQQFHKYGLSPQNAQSFVNDWNTFIGEQTAERLAADNTTNDQEIAALEQKWGGNLDAQLAAGKRAVEALGVAPALIERVESRIGTAAIVELMATIGQKVSEGGTLPPPSGGAQDTPESMSKEGATAKIALLGTDTDFQAKYTDKNHPQHADAVAFMERLHRRAAQAT